MSAIVVQVPFADKQTSTHLPVSIAGIAIAPIFIWKPESAHSSKKIVI